jgi:hypothetical protein
MAAPSDPERWRHIERIYHSALERLGAYAGSIWMAGHEGVVR